MPIMNNAVVTASTACCFLRTYTKECSCLKRSSKWRKTLFLHRLKPTNSPPDEMHTALQHIYSSLQALQAQEDANGSIPRVTRETQPEPVHWRKSITKHHVKCLACGVSFKQLS